MSKRRKSQPKYIQTATHLLGDDMEMCLPGDTGTTDGNGLVLDYTAAVYLELLAESIEGRYDEAGDYVGAFVRNLAQRARKEGVVFLKDFSRLVAPRSVHARAN